MKNANQPISPDPMRGCEQSYTNQSPNELPTGLTKREYFAGLAIQGAADTGMLPTEIIQISKAAVFIADELLKQLEKGN